MERDADYFPLLGRSGLGDSQEYHSVPNVSAENFLIFNFSFLIYNLYSRTASYAFTPHYAKIEPDETQKPH
jgi:hypothetical protein